MARITATTYEAKAQLSQLLAACERGDEVTITRGRKPVARLVPVEALPQRESGFLSLHLSPESVAESMAPLGRESLPDWYPQDAE